MPNTNPISLMADELLETFADVARTALRVRAMSRERLVIHVLGLLSETEQKVWATVVVAAVDKAIFDMLPVNERQQTSMPA